MYITEPHFSLLSINIPHWTISFVYCKLTWSKFYSFSVLLIHVYCKKVNLSNLLNSERWHHLLWFAASFPYASWKHIGIIISDPVWFWLKNSRPDTLDPALLRPGRLDRKVEFGLPDLESRTQIFKIHTRTMNCERDIRFELLARLCPNSTGNIMPSKLIDFSAFYFIFQPLNNID